MDFVQGRTLAEIVRDGPLPGYRAARYAQRIAEAIEYAHSRGVLHRDQMSHEGAVNFGQFSRDGQVLVTTPLDNSAHLWHVPTAAPLCQPLRQQERIVYADFSPDGRHLATASYDAVVQVWDIQIRRAQGIKLVHQNIETSRFNAANLAWRMTVKGEQC